MKRFNIVKQDVILWNKYHLPINACFGCFPVTYKKYIRTDKVTTKSGKVIDKKRFKEITEEIIYYVDNFKALKNYGEEEYTAYNIHVYDKQRDKWIDTNTQACAKYKPLGDFLAEMFEKNNIKPTTKCIYWIDYRTGRPQEKKPQCHSDSIFKSNVGYVLSKNVITAHNINRDGWNSYDKIANGGI